MTPTLQRPTSERVALPAAGDHDAFASFYRTYCDAVLWYFRRRVRDAELAADLMMEVFAAALLACHRETIEPEDAVAWLFGVARNKLADSYRRGTVEASARQRLGLERLAVTDDDLERIDDLTHEDRIIELVAALPAEQREVVVARVLADEDYDRIAERMGTSPMVVRKRLSRALRGLKLSIGRRG